MPRVLGVAISMDKVETFWYCQKRGLVFRMEERQKGPELETSTSRTGACYVIMLLNYLSGLAVDCPGEVDGQREHALNQWVVVPLHRLAHLAWLQIQHYQCCDVECYLLK